jgi:hypothetical protein
MAAHVVPLMEECGVPAVDRRKLQEIIPVAQLEAVAAAMPREEVPAPAVRIGL